jgi:hypothetical protein
MGVSVSKADLFLPYMYDPSAAGFIKTLQMPVMKNTMLKVLLLTDETGQCNKTNPQLGLDEACLEVISSSSSNNCTLWAQSEECDKVNEHMCFL